MEEEKMSSCSPPLSTSFSSSSSSSTTTTTASQNSRWNPTKEQIAILEGLYWQGIRTPTADQIQQITGKLREFGAIEGKNVFYWFQNHKARQRQKQKQESFAYFSHLLHRRPQPPSPPPPISYNNVVCAPFCLQVSQVAGIGLYKPQYPLMSKLQRMEMDSKKPVSREQCCYETLQLFPLHPTGILEEKPAGSSLTSACMGADCNKEFHHQEKEDEEEEEDQEEGCESFPIFNFFAC